jgi:hypothetical protein
MSEEKAEVLELFPVMHQELTVAPDPLGLYRFPVPST